ncbi:hypothetical protein Zmor_016989 [Zophobas morio]|uniref:Uncharacterized protein n=1 Tax=Zophobas morio TaxID=2755281 RepID=A0AA38I8V2_9CUCU|nr:hypothetical protein Zmor_016989 [Zophobas morio]
MRIVLTFVPLLVLSSCVKIPPNFHKCNRKSPDFQTCMFESAKKGVLELVRPYPELTIPSFDPFELTEMTIGGTDGPVYFQQKFTKCKFYGLVDLDIDNFEFNFEKKVVRMSGMFPEIQMVCDYEVKVKILVLNIHGIGNSTVILKNLKITDVLPFEETKRMGRTFPNFKSSSVTIDPELVVFNFENHKNKALSDSVNPILNNNWKDIFDEVKGEYAQVIDRIVLNVVNSFFNKVTFEEAFDST